MSSRPVDETSAAGPRRPMFRWTIGARLAALYSLTALLLLAGVGVYLYDGLRSGLAEEDHALVADEIRLLRSIVADEPADRVALETKFQLEQAARRFNPYYARILDATGRSTLETPRMHDVLPPEVFPPPLAPEAEPSRGTYWTAPDGKVFLLLAASTRVTGASSAAGFVQAAIDVSAESRLLADYRRRLFGSIVIGVLASLIAGVLVARHGLRPVGVMTRTVRRITPSRLHQRLEASDWPAELAGLAEAFDQTLERLEDSFDRLRRFSDDIAHELRTPLNNILGQTEVALTRARSGANAHDVLESNLEEIRRIARVIDSLLFLSRADHAVTALERTRLAVRPLLESTVELYRPLAEEKGVRLQCEGDGNLVADETLVRRALSNVTSNALAAVGCGGEVRISAAQDPSGSLRICVRDTGVGIAEDQLDRIFDRFYRIRDPRAEPREGSGLGLSIVKSIMELHGGTIGVTSAPGRGSRFELAFPAR